MTFSAENFCKAEVAINGFGKYVTFRLTFPHNRMLEFNHMLSEFDEGQHRAYVERQAVYALERELDSAFGAVEELRYHPARTVAKLSWRTIWRGVRRKLTQKETA